MKLKIKTETLKEMVSRVVKGAGNNKLIPLTQMMKIELKDKILTLCTTDMTNFLYIRENKVDGDDFYAVVGVDQFSKLISKMTSENTELDLKENSLQVKGNGKYSVALQYDEDGEMVQYPDPLDEFEAEGDGIDIQESTIRRILESVKPALAQTLENPCYTGYYIGDTVVATDTYLINSYNVNLFKQAKLVSAEVMDLLAVMSAEKIHVDLKENVMVFSSPDCVVYGRDLEGIEDFAIDAISKYFQMGFDSMCKISRQALLQVLDRLVLFVTTYDKGGIYLTMTKDGLQISSKSSDGVELIEYVESKDFKDFTCCIDVNLLQKQVKSQVGEAVELWYGEDNVIKMVDGDVIQMVALMEDDRAEEE